MIFLRETPFRQAVIEVAEKTGFLVTHIESPLTSAGVPDLNLYHGVDVWLELKVWSAMRGVQMRPTQKRWHTQRSNAHGLSWVLLHHEGRLSLIPGALAATLKGRDPSWRTDFVVGMQDDLERVLWLCHEAIMRHDDAIDTYLRLAREPSTLNRPFVSPSRP